MSGEFTDVLKNIAKLRPKPEMAERMSPTAVLRVSWLTTDPKKVSNSPRTKLARTTTWKVRVSEKTHAYIIVIVSC